MQIDICHAPVHTTYAAFLFYNLRKGADNYEDGRSDISETADTVGEVAKEGAVKAMETGIEKAKETMDIAWDGFKETTKNVKDAVVGNDDDPI